MTSCSCLRTAQKMEFSIKDFSSKFDQMRSFLQIWSHLREKFLMGNFTFLCFIVICDNSFSTYVASLRIQPECGKMRTRITPNTDTFYAVMLFYFMWNLFTVGRLQFCNDSTIASLEANQNPPRIKYVNK